MHVADTLTYKRSIFIYYRIFTLVSCFLHSWGF